MFLCLLCAISGSIDSLSVGVSYGIKKINLPIESIILVSFISTLGTYISMEFGNIILLYTGENLINLVASIFLIFMGLYFVYESIQRENMQVTELLGNPIKADYNKSGKIDFSEAGILALALTLNNVGIGIASAIAGLDVILTSIFTFIFTAISLQFGYSLGSRYASKNFGAYAQIVSGLLIISLGVMNIIL